MPKELTRQNKELTRQIAEEVQTLPPEQKRRVLEFARALVMTQPKGVPGRELLRFVGLIEKEDLRRMAEAIEEGCERIDPHGW